MEKYSRAGQATDDNIAHARLNVTLYLHCLSVEFEMATSSKVLFQVLLTFKRYF